MNDFDKGNKADEEMITLIMELLEENKEEGRKGTARAVWYSVKARLNRERPKVADRKKEVIEIITNYLDNAVINARAVTSYIPGCVAEEVYDRIAPLMAREFPEEAFKEMLGNLVLITCDLAVRESFLEDWKNHFKHLWEGGEEQGGIVSDPEILKSERLGAFAITPQPVLIKGNRYRLSGIADKPIEFTASDSVHIVQIGKIDKSNPPCQKCGGMRKFYDDEYGTDMDCPQCGGTGEERRKGRERRETLPQTEFVSGQSKKVYFYAIEEPLLRDGLEVDVWKTDRRIKPDRRKHPEESL